MLTLRPSELTCASTTLMLRIRTVRCGGRVSKEREKEGEREREKAEEGGYRVRVSA